MQVIRPAIPRASRILVVIAVFTMALVAGLAGVDGIMSGRKRPGTAEKRRKPIGKAALRATDANCIGPNTPVGLIVPDASLLAIRRTGAIRSSADTFASETL